MPPTTALNFVVISIIVALFMIDMFSFWLDGGREHRSLKGEMTGLGILGTFVGIFLGLWKFDATAISESIPALLEGLKTAFLTSIAGLVFSVFASIIQAIFPTRFARTGDPIADKVNDLVQSLDESISRMVGGQQLVVENVGLMRTDLASTLDELSNGASEAIIDALRGVINDFNSNLTEQFGGNFAKLNDACEQLVQWQQDNQMALETATTAMDTAVDAVRVAVRGVEAHTQRAEELNDALAKGQTSITGMTALINLMDKNSTGLAETMENVELALTNAKRDLSSIHETWENAGTSARETSEALADASRTSVQISERLEKEVDLADGHIEDAHKRLEESLTSLTEHFGTSYKQFLEGLRMFTEAENRISDHTKK